MTIITRISHGLDYCGFTKTAAFIRAVEREGNLTSPQENSQGSFTRGLAHFITPTASYTTGRERILNAVAVASKFKYGIGFELWKDQYNWQSPSIVAKLIKEGSLGNQELRILDVGCHEGGLVDSLEELPDLRIRRYLGIDISQDAIEHAKSKHPGHDFLAADALSIDTYNSGLLPDDNNIITCTGLFDYFSPKEIMQVLNLLKNKLDQNENARLYVSYATTMPSYNIDLSQASKALLDIYRHVYSGKSRRATKSCTEAEIRYFVNTTTTLKFYRYSPDEFAKLVDACGLEIVKENSKSNLPHNNFFPLKVHTEHGQYSSVRVANDHLCLRRKV